MIKINTIRPLLLTSISLILLSCASSVPKNELRNLPSLVEIMDLNLTTAQLKIRVSHRNNQTRTNNQLSCQLALKNSPPIKFDEITIPDLTNYAVETINISLDINNIDVTGHTHKELPYVLDCFLFSENFRQEHLINKSTLYKVPGTAANYR